MSALWNLIPIQYRMGAVAAGILLLVAGAGGATLKIDQNGYHRAQLEDQVKLDKMLADIARETALRAAAEQAANDAAKAEEAAELEAYRKRAMASADRAMTLAAEAAADPNHDNVALDPDAVDRHNRRIAP